MRTIISLVALITFVACRNECHERFFYRIGTNDIFLSTEKNQICVSRRLSDLVRSTWREDCPRLIIKTKGSAMMYISPKDTCYYFVKDNSCIDSVYPSYRGYFVWLADNTPSSFLDSMIQIQLPWGGRELLARDNSCDEWRHANRLTNDEIKEIISTTPNKPFNRIKGILRIPTPGENDIKDIDISFSDIGKDGIIVMNLNGDHVYIKPYILNDILTHYMYYPQLIVYKENSNLLYFSEDYNSLIPKCKKYSLVYRNNRALLWDDNNKRVEFSFIHACYDALEKDVKELNEQYKIDGISIVLSCRGKAREMVYSDGTLEDQKLSWKKQMHLWTSEDITDSIVTKRAFSPRTFFTLYKLQSGEYILGGPSYKIIENLPSGVIRIDNSNYHESNGIPESPDDLDYALYDNKTGLEVEVDRAITIYELPEGPHVWYLDGTKDHKVCRLNKFN